MRPWLCLCTCCCIDEHGGARPENRRADCSCKRYWPSYDEGVAQTAQFLEDHGHSPEAMELREAWGKAVTLVAVTK